MLFNQVRVRYNKDSWLASSYLSEFLKMCGFMVYEEKVDFETTDLEKPDKEVIINVTQKELGKQLLEEAITEYLADSVDITKLRLLIDFYVDFSVYEFMMWVRYYCAYDDYENCLTNSHKLFSSLTFLNTHNEFDKNEFARFAVLYCRYQIRYITKLHNRILYDVDEKACSKLIKEFPNSFLISGNILLSLIQENDHAMEAIGYLNSALEYCLPCNKAFVYCRLAGWYSKYGTRLNTAFSLYKKSIELDPTNIQFLFQLVCFLANNKQQMCQLYITKNPYYTGIADHPYLALPYDYTLEDKFMCEYNDTIIPYIKNALSLLATKEAEIPLNPQELRIRCTLITRLIIIYGSLAYYKPAQLNSSIQEAYLAIDSSSFWNVFELKEFRTKDSPNLVIKKSLKDTLKLARYYLVAAYDGMHEPELVKKAQGYFSDVL